MVLTGIVACFVAAYTINIGNQDSYGILNLRKIYLRNGPNETITGIALDGETYTISVAKGQPTDTGKIEVYQICGRTGGDCKKVSELVSVSGSNLSSGGYCKYIDEQRIPQGHGLPDIVVPAHFECTTINPYTLPLASDSVTGGIKLGGSSGDKSYSVQLDNNNKAYVSVPWEDNNTHYTGNLYIQANGAAAITFDQVSDKTLNIKQGTNTNVYYSDEDNGRGGTTPTITISATDTNTHYTGTLTIKGGGKTGIVFYQSGNATLNITGGGGITVTTGSSAGTIIISGAAGGGDGLWELAGEEETSPIRPKDEKNITFSQTNATITHGGSLTIDKAGTLTSPTSNITFDSKGMRIGGSSYTGNGLGLNGGMFVMGSKNSSHNKITIYASGATATNASNYEILGSMRLLVGTYNKGYIYFNDKKQVGINTTSLIDGLNPTLTVNGGIQIGSACTRRSCDEYNVGTLIYYETGNVGWLAFCRRKNETEWGRYKLGGSSTSSGDLHIDTCNSVEPINSSMYQSELSYPGLATY